MFGTTYSHIKLRYLQHHKQRSSPNENTAYEWFYRELLMKDKCGQDQRDYNAEFVNGNNFGGLSDLQSFVVAKPWSTGGKPGKNQKDPASFGYRD